MRKHLSYGNCFNEEDKKDKKWYKISLQMAIDGAEELLRFLSNNELTYEDVEQPTSGVSCTLDWIEVINGNSEEGGLGYLIIEENSEEIQNLLIRVIQTAKKELESFE